MTASNKLFRIAITAVLTLATALAQAPQPLLHGPQHSAAKPAAVQYLYPEQVAIPAGKPTSVTLHFRIESGLHINSHTPKDDVLIPATFSIPEGFGVRLESAAYPLGTNFTLPLDPKTKLSVYTGEFTIQARLVATVGDHLVEARLRFQACDNNACMPPKTITAAINVIGK